MLQRAARPHIRGIVPLHDTEPLAFQIFGRFNAGFTVDENVSQTKLAVRKRRDRYMRQSLGMRAHARGKAAVPGVCIALVVDEYPVETVDLYGSVRDRNVGIDRRLPEIE